MDLLGGGLATDSMNSKLIRRNDFFKVKRNKYNSICTKFSILHLNVNSIFSKLHEVSQLLDKNFDLISFKYHFIVIQIIICCAWTVIVMVVVY